MLMRISDKRIWIHFIVLSVFLCSLTGCLTAKKLDKFVATEYNNELPKPNKKRIADIEITPAYATDNSAISSSVHTTDKFLPLLVYWKYDHRQSCALNPTISVTSFSNTVNSIATKGLTEKLNGRKLEITVEQTPSAFSIVSKEQMVWLVYAFGWSKVYIEPDGKDLVVFYKLSDSGNVSKTGKITVKNTDKNKSLRYFQSWKSASSEYLSDYNASLTNMAKSFVAQLIKEI
jgi:hypothetical protein